MRALFAVIFVFQSILGVAQYDREGARQAMHTLKDGVLVVRLFWEEARVEHVRENGTDEEYLELVNEIDLRNKEIMDAFIEHYTVGSFCFMSSGDSEKLIGGDWDGIFYDAEGNKIIVDPCDYLVADISRTRNLSLKGLNIWEWDGRNWVHPPSPFPAFVSIYGFLSLSTRTYGEVVQRWNEMLTGN